MAASGPDQQPAVDLRGGPITGGREVPCSLRGLAQGGPMLMAGDGGCRAVDRRLGISPPRAHPPPGRRHPRRTGRRAGCDLWSHEHCFARQGATGCTNVSIDNGGIQRTRSSQLTNPQFDATGVLVPVCATDQSWPPATRGEIHRQALRQLADTDWPEFPTFASSAEVPTHEISPGPEILSGRREF